MGRKYEDELKIKKRRRLALKLTLFLFAAIGAGAGLLYFLFFARLFDVRFVSVNTPAGLYADVNQTVNGWLDSGFWNFSRRKNILFFSADKLSFQLVNKFPKLEDVKITKIFPHSVSVSGDERKPAGVWCQTSQNKCFYFDQNGIAFMETRPSSGFLLANITDQRNRSVSLGGPIVADSWFRNIMSALKFLATANISVSELVIPADSFDEFDAKTVWGWKIMFSIQTDIEKQIGILATFLKEKIGSGQRQGLQYVDLRIQNRIYYK